MDDSNKGTLVFSLVVGGVLYWWYQRQQTAVQYSGVPDSITADIGTLSQNVSNYVENTVIGSTRGERNNNPGNINLRNGAGQVIAWQGLAPTQTDSRFAQFTDVTYGIRALHKNLLTMFGRGNNTVKLIISAYAPANDNNNTAAYIGAICAALGVMPNEVIDLNNADTAYKFCNAVIIHENGSNPYLATGQFDTGMGMT